MYTDDNLFNEFCKLQLDLEVKPSVTEFMERWTSYKEVKKNEIRTVSQAYAMIDNLINLANFHREYCNKSCNVSLWRVKETCIALIPSLKENEKPEIWKLINLTNWM